MQIRSLVYMDHGRTYTPYLLLQIDFYIIIYTHNPQVIIVGRGKRASRGSTWVPIGFYKKKEVSSCTAINDLNHPPPQIELYVCILYT